MKQENEAKALKSESHQQMTNYRSICLELVARHYAKDEYDFKTECLYLANCHGVLDKVFTGNGYDFQLTARL